MSNRMKMLALLLLLASVASADQVYEPQHDLSGPRKPRAPLKHIGCTCDKSGKPVNCPSGVTCKVKK